MFAGAWSGELTVFRHYSSSRETSALRVINLQAGTPLLYELLFFEQRSLCFTSQESLLSKQKNSRTSPLESRVCRDKKGTLGLVQSQSGSVVVSGCDSGSAEPGSLELFELFYL